MPLELEVNGKQISYRSSHLDMVTYRQHIFLIKNALKNTGEVIIILPMNNLLKGNKRVLRLNVRCEYWEQVQRGEKIYEYRLCKEYWRKRLEEKIYSYIAYCLGYPKKDDMSRTLLRKWKGYELLNNKL